MATTILFLGPPSPVLDYLRTRETFVTQTTARLTMPNASGHDWLVSFGYRHILSPEILALFPGRAVNLHISYLPWNRGKHPNVWSWYDATPKGVTLHEMDAGIDTGPILGRVEHLFTRPEQETLATSHARLQGLAAWLFSMTWPRLERGSVRARPQPCGGSFHTATDLERLRPLMTQGWDTPCSVIAEAGRRARDQREG